MESGLLDDGALSHAVESHDVDEAVLVVFQEIDDLADVVVPADHVDITNLVFKQLLGRQFLVVHLKLTGFECSNGLAIVTLMLILQDVLIKLLLLFIVFDVVGLVFWPDDYEF